LRDADWLRYPRARRGNVRYQAQENLRAHADTHSPQTHEEKIGGREVADAEAERNAGEIAVAEKKDRCESDSVGDAISECVCFSEEEEKIFAESHPGIFAECVGSSEKEKVFTESHSGGVPKRVEQEEETQGVADAQPIAG